MLAAPLIHDVGWDETTDQQRPGQQPQRYVHLCKRNASRVAKRLNHPSPCEPFPDEHGLPRASQGSVAQMHACDTDESPSQRCQDCPLRSRLHTHALTQRTPNPSVARRSKKASRDFAASAGDSGLSSNQLY